MPQGEVTFEVDQTALDALRANLEGISNGVERASIWACNRTAEHLRTVISTKIRNRIPIKKRDIDRYIKIKRASSRGGQDIQSTVTLSKSKRIPLKYFGVKQVGVAAAQRTADRSRSFGGRRVGGGVVYPIGKHFAEHGFMGPKPGKIATKLFGQAWTRPNQGPRKPIKVLKGPSPWGVFVLTGAMPETLIDAKAEMDKNLGQVVNYLLLQKAGGVMTFCIIELIAQAIIGRLENITVANGYSFDVGAVVRPTRDGQFVDSDGTRFASIADNYCVITQSKLGRDSETNAMGNKGPWLADFSLDLFVIPSDKSTQPAHKLSNEFAAQAMKAIATSEDGRDWARFGNLAINAWFDAVDAFVPQQGEHSGATLELKVQFRTQENNPYETA